jgi:DNA-binding Lrp family transcriptional regulator
MDDTDTRLIAALRKDGRASISALAMELGLSRATVRSRIDRLTSAGTILGFTAVLREDTDHVPVRGMMMIEIEGRGTERVIRALSGLPSVEAIHTTNGKWDLIVELGAQSLEQFDEVLRHVRLLEGIATSETNLLLATRKMARLKMR